jgi:hypothetical protein
MINSSLQIQFFHPTLASVRFNIEKDSTAFGCFIFPRGFLEAFFICHFDPISDIEI